MRTIYLDCTRTFQTHVHTGIERMVSGLLHAAPQLAKQFQVRCQPLVFRTATGFEPLTPQMVTDRFRPRDPHAPARVSWKQKLRRQVDRVGLMEVARSTRNVFDATAETVLAPVRGCFPPRVEFQPGDLMVLLDVNVRSHYWPDLHRARRAGAEICQCVCDLIPLSHPEAVDGGVVRDFTRWWRNVTAVCGSYICISQATWREVQSHLPPGSEGVRGTSFRLGVGLDKMSGQVAPRAELQAAFQHPPTRPVYLTVGMMSPRKNHALALDALERLWPDPDGPALVIVGKFGWRCEEVARRIKQHPELNRRLFWFESVTDDELDYCYRHATATLSTSFAEGFNLPIVESLSRGTPMIATDIPTHREVGGRFATYFPVHDAAALAAVLREPELARARQQVRSAREFAWPDWTGSTHEFLQRLGELSRGVAAVSPEVRPLSRAA